MQVDNSNYDLLIQCCSENIDIDALNIAISKVRDWEYFYKIVYMHGVLPLVYKKFKNPKINISKDILLRFKKSYVKIAKMNMIMSVELINIMQILKSKGIYAITFKGPTLSQMLYDDITMRQYSDIDILINKDDLLDAARLIMKEKYSMDFHINFLENKQYLKVAKDIHLVSNKFDILIELHWKLFENKFVFKDDAVFTQRQEVIINTHKLETLESESLLLYLCIHGSKHFWERLEWIVDVDRLIRKNCDINWSHIEEKASKMQSSRLFYFGLLVSHTLFKTPLPQTIHTKMLQYENIQKMTNEVIEALYDNKLARDLTTIIDLQHINNMVKLTDTDALSIKTRLRAYFILKEGDILLVNLPSPLSWIYYLLRPLRIFKKYFLT